MGTIWFCVKPISKTMVLRLLGLTLTSFSSIRTAGQLLGVTEKDARADDARLRPAFMSTEKV